MNHVTKDGAPKLGVPCDLNVAGVRVVQRIITDLATLAVGRGERA